MQGILVALIVFFLTIDQHSLTRVLHRPIVACTLIGAILGNIQTGAIVGGTLELIVIGTDSIESNMLLCSVASVLLAIQSEMDATTAISSSLVFAWISYYLDQAWTALTTLILPKTRNDAAKKEEKALSVDLFLPGILKGLVFAVISFLIVNQMDGMRAFFDGIEESAGWLVATLQASGALFASLGLAILLRNLQADQAPEALLFGIGVGAILIYVMQESNALVIAGLFAIAMAVYLFKNTLKTSTASSHTKEGGSAKWW